MNKNIIAQNDLIGEKYGRLIVLENIPSDIGGRRVRCQCDCGEVTDVYRAKLLDSHTKSCGCLRKEISRERRTSHGYSSRNSPHYYLYRLCQSIMQRCQNPLLPIYKYYGGRGISVDPNWENPVNFIEYIIEHLGHRPTEKHSIDRISNDLGYCPGNVKWSTQTEQMLNTRRSNKNKVLGAV